MPSQPNPRIRTRFPKISADSYRGQAVQHRTACFLLPKKKVKKICHRKAHQVKILQELLQLEKEIVFTAFINQMAVEIGMRLYETARAEGQSVTIDITRSGQRLFYLAMEGTCAGREHCSRYRY